MIFLTYSSHKLEMIFKNLCLAECIFIVCIYYLLLEVLFLPPHPHFHDDGGAGGERWKLVGRTSQAAPILP